MINIFSIFMPQKLSSNVLSKIQNGDISPNDFKNILSTLSDFNSDGEDILMNANLDFNLDKESVFSLKNLEILKNGKDIVDSNMSKNILSLFNSFVSQQTYDDLSNKNSISDSSLAKDEILSSINNVSLENTDIDLIKSVDMMKKNFGFINSILNIIEKKLNENGFLKENINPFYKFAEEDLIPNLKIFKDLLKNNNDLQQDGNFISLIQISIPFDAYNQKEMNDKFPVMELSNHQYPEEHVNVEIGEPVNTNHLIDNKFTDKYYESENNVLKSFYFLEVTDDQAADKSSYQKLSFIQFNLTDNEKKSAFNYPVQIKNGKVSIDRNQGFYISNENQISSVEIENKNAAVTKELSSFINNHLPHLTENKANAAVEFDESKSNLILKLNERVNELGFQKNKSDNNISHTGHLNTDHNYDIEFSSGIEIDEEVVQDFKYANLSNLEIKSSSERNISTEQTSVNENLSNSADSINKNSTIISNSENSLNSANLSNDILTSNDEKNSTNSDNLSENNSLSTNKNLDHSVMLNRDSQEINKYSSLFDSETEKKENKVAIGQEDIVPKTHSMKMDYQDNEIAANNTNNINNIKSSLVAGMSKENLDNKVKAVNPKYEINYSDSKNISHSKGKSTVDNDNKIFEQFTLDKNSENTFSQNINISLEQKTSISADMNLKDSSDENSRNNLENDTKNFVVNDNDKKNNSNESKTDAVDINDTDISVKPNSDKNEFMKNHDRTDITAKNERVNSENKLDIQNEDHHDELVRAKTNISKSSNKKMNQHETSQNKAHNEFSKNKTHNQLKIDSYETNSLKTDSDLITDTKNSSELDSIEILQNKNADKNYTEVKNTAAANKKLANLSVKSDEKPLAENTFESNYKEVSTYKTVNKTEEPVNKFQNSKNDDSSKVEIVSFSENSNTDNSSKTETMNNPLTNSEELNPNHNDVTIDLIKEKISYLSSNEINEKKHSEIDLSRLTQYRVKNEDQSTDNIKQSIDSDDSLIINNNKNSVNLNKSVKLTENNNSANDEYELKIVSEKNISKENNVTKGETDNSDDLINSKKQLKAEKSNTASSIEKNPTLSANKNVNENISETAKQKQDIINKSGTNILDKTYDESIAKSQADDFIKSENLNNIERRINTDKNQMEADENIPDKINKSSNNEIEFKDKIDKISELELKKSAKDIDMKSNKNTESKKDNSELSKHRSENNGNKESQKSSKYKVIEEVQNVSKNISDENSKVFKESKSDTNSKTELESKEVKFNQTYEQNSESGSNNSGNQESKDKNENLNFSKSHENSSSDDVQEFFENRLHEKIDNKLHRTNEIREKFENLSENFKNDVMNQIAKKMHFNLKDKVQEAKIDLYPKSLGKITVRILTEETEMKGRIDVETEMAAHIVKENIDKLAANLKESGLNVQKLEINIVSDNTENYQNNLFMSQQNRRDFETGKSKAGNKNSEDKNKTDQNIKIEKNIVRDDKVDLKV